MARNKTSGVSIVTSQPYRKNCPFESKLRFRRGARNPIPNEAPAVKTPESLNLVANDSPPAACSIDPNKNLMQNVLQGSNAANGCYVIKMASGDGGDEHGSAAERYIQVIYEGNDPEHELVFIGDYPDAREISLTVNDSHNGIASSRDGVSAQILGEKIVPLGFR